VGQMRVEMVETFEYLRVGLDKTNGVQVGVQRRLGSVNRHKFESL